MKRTLLKILFGGMGLGMLGLATPVQAQLKVSQLASVPTLGTNDAFLVETNLYGANPGTRLMNPTNLILALMGLPNWSAVRVPLATNAITATNLSSGGQFISPLFTGASLNGGNAIRIGGSSGHLTLSDTNVPNPLLTWDGDFNMSTGSTTNQNGAFVAKQTGGFIGDGSLLSGLNGSSVSSGTIADGRLSANVPLLNANNVFSGTNNAANLGVTGSLSAGNQNFRADASGNVVGAQYKATTRPAFVSYVDPTYMGGSTNAVWQIGANASIPDCTIDLYSNAVQIARFMFTPEGPLVTRGFSDNGTSYPGSNVFANPTFITTPTLYGNSSKSNWAAMGPQGLIISNLDGNHIDLGDGNISATDTASASNWNFAALTYLASPMAYLGLDSNSNAVETTDGSGYTNLNASTLKSGYWSYEMTADAIEPAPVGTSMAWLTNTPSSYPTNTLGAGPAYTAWGSSVSASNQVMVRFKLPYDYDGGKINLSLGITGGTNANNHKVIVSGAAFATLNTAVPAFISVTNNLPVQTSAWAQSLRITGLTIAGSPAPRADCYGILDIDAGSAGSSFTNNILVLSASIDGTKTNAVQSSLTLP